MNLEIVSAEMSRKEDKSYVGRTVFTLENHKAPYEITFFSTRGTEWDYSLSFAGEPWERGTVLRNGCIAGE